MRRRISIRLSGNSSRPLWIQLLLGAGTAVLCTLICLPLSTFFPLAELVMVYILGVMLASLQLNRMASAVTAVVCAASFDFFFVLPRFGLVPSDLKHLVTVAGLLALGMVISTLTARLRSQLVAVEIEQQRTSALLGLSRDLARTESIGGLVSAAAEHVGKFFSGPAAVFMPNLQGRLEPVTAVNAERGAPQLSLAADAWFSVAETAYQSGLDEDVSVASGLGMVSVPLAASRGKVGAMAVKIGRGRVLSGQEKSQLKAFAAQAGLAIERAQLEMEAEEAKLSAETERMRSALLSSVSHDLRTPLGAITGATSALLGDDKLLRSESGRDLLTTVYEEAERLNRLVGSLLYMTRLEGGAVVPNKEWQPLEEVIGAALTRRTAQLANHHVTLRMDDGLPLVKIDSVLIEQALGNIVDNAALHTPPGTEVEVEARMVEGGAEIVVADRGPGLRPGEASLVFDKFYRGSASHAGAGLGLAVARGIIEVHGGRVWAEERQGEGSAFHILLPVADTPPEFLLARARDDELLEGS